MITPPVSVDSVSVCGRSVKSNRVPEQALGLAMRQSQRLYEHWRRAPVRRI